MAAAASAWRQRGVSGGGTINNQLKASAATAAELATITATTTMIKTKAAAAGSGLFTVVEGPPTTKVTKQTKKEQLHRRHLFIIGLIPAPSVKQIVQANIFH